VGQNNNKFGAPPTNPVSSSLSNNIPLNILPQIKEYSFLNKQTKQLIRQNRIKQIVKDVLEHIQEELKENKFAVIAYSELYRKTR
jgi:hypothetical protein